MAAQYYKINYKSDFVLTINSDAGWAVPFCIKFWTGMPSQAYFVGFDGVKYVNCRVGDTPTQLLVMFDDHHLPIGPLRMQIAYHTTIEEFPGSVFDEVTNARDVIVTIDGTDYQVLLDFTGEDTPELEFDLPAYANEAERIQNELQRQQNEAARIAAELQREQATAAAVQGAENVNAQLNGTTLTVTNRQGVSTSVNTKGEQGEQGPVGPEGPQGEQGVSITGLVKTGETETDTLYNVTFSDGTTQAVAIPKGEKGDRGPVGPQGQQGQMGVSITGLVKTGETETDTLYNVTFSDGTTQAVAIPKGEKGDKGDTGNTGATGATGATGPRGPQGERGLPGESGVTGDVSAFTVRQTIDPSATYGPTDIAGAAALQAANAELTELAGEVDNIEDAVNANSETTPTYTVTSGKYVASNGVLADNSSFSKTSKFSVVAGDTVILDGRGNSSIAVIAKTNEDETSYTSLVIGQGNSQDNVYSYKFTEDSYAVVSYYRLNSLTIKNADNVTILKGRVDNIDATLSTLQTKANLVTGISEQSTNDTYPGAKAVFDYSKKANDVAGKLNPLLDTFDLLHPYAIFNGINSAASITQVDLTSNGDFLEMELFPDASIASPYAYGLVNWDTAQVSVGASQTNIWVRGHDTSRTWVASGVSIGGTKARYILKVLFDDNKIKIYVDGTLIHTYNGQVPISLKYWGLYSSGSSYYWKGKIGYINVNGNVSYITDLPGYNGNIKLETENGFLTEAQASILAQSGDYPNIFISAASESVNVYNKVHDNIYVKFTINHQVDTSTGQYKYKDLWRIASQGDFCVYNGESFTSLGIKLLVSAENEFAIKFAGFLDFTGGYHGYERIDLDPSCYCVFVLDGKEYTISDLVSLGDVNGNSFEYRQKSFCYTDSGYSQSPIHFANHVKRTLFECGGFVTRNYFETIMDGLSVSTLTAETAFEGLVCVSEDCANKVVGVDGTIYSTTHPATSVILVNNINKTSRFIKMFNGAASCCLDAKMVGTSVSGYATPGNRVQIMDRADDTKYYAYLPSNVAWGDGDSMEVECVVKYDYRASN